MLIVGQVNSEEEKNNLQFIAQVFIIGNRFRYIAKKSKK